MLRLLFSLDLSSLISFSFSFYSLSLFSFPSILSPSSSSSSFSSCFYFLSVFPVFSILTSFFSPPLQFLFRLLTFYFFPPSLSLPFLLNFDSPPPPTFPPLLSSLFHSCVICLLRFVFLTPSLPLCAPPSITPLSISSPSSRLSILTFIFLLPRSSQTRL